MYFYCFGFIILIYGHNLYGSGKYLIRSIRALFDCVSSLLMCKTGQVQAEQVKSNLEINCMLDVKMNTYLKMPKKIYTPPLPKKTPRKHNIILMCMNGSQAYKIYWVILLLCSALNQFWWSPMLYNINRNKSKEDNRMSLNMP